MIKITCTGTDTQKLSELKEFQKSFYSVMFSPSNTKIGVIRDTHARIHYSITWAHVTPKILRQEWKR